MRGRGRVRVEMGAKRSRSSAELYLETYPRLRKWINQCAVCQRLGYKPEMLEQLEKPIARKHLMRYFPAMAVDAASLCESCAAHLPPRT